MSLRSWNSSQDILGDYSKRKGLKLISLGLEAFGAVVVAVTAIYLRIADLHPSTAGLNWYVVCNDSSLTYEEPVNDDPILLYVIVILVPVLFMLILELEHSLFSKSPTFENLESSERIWKSLPRFGGVIALFVTGIFLTSFFADYLMIVIVRPRPYFLQKYGANCPLPWSGARDNDFYHALKSFPSHLACIAGFCCMFAAGLAHSTRYAQGSQIPSVLLPIMSQGFVVLAVTAGLDGYTSHQNHLWDITGGLVIGLVIALYMSSLLYGNTLTTTENNAPWSNFWNMFIPRARVTLPPTNAEARNEMTRNA